MRKKAKENRSTSTVEPNNNQPAGQNYQQIVNQREDESNMIRGWRKLCLFFLIFLLVVMISVNLTLTIWILKNIEISSGTIGQLKIEEGGVQLDGQAMILDELRTSNLRSRQSQPMTFESKNLTFNTRNSNGLVENQLFLAHGKLEVQAKSFRVLDSNRTTLLYVEGDGIEIGAEKLKVKDEVTFKDSIQTNCLKAEPGKDLKLESPTRNLSIKAAEDITIQTPVGNIEIHSTNDIKFKSNSGKIRLNGNITFTDLTTTKAPTGNERQKSDDPAMHKIYQVCACDNGKLFLSPSHSHCDNYLVDVCT